MDKNVEWVIKKKVERAAKALEENGFSVHVLARASDVVPFLDGFVEEGSVVTVGGSRTVFESGVVDYLRSGKFSFLDRYKEGLTLEDMRQLYRDAFSADYYFMSANAITEDGFLFNVDGTGNRVAALSYGPDRVIVIAGHNKIVADEHAAYVRNMEVSGPSNGKRLNRKTPCAFTGICEECKSPERMCNQYVTTKRNLQNRIVVILVEEALGY